MQKSELRRKLRKLGARPLPTGRSPHQKWVGVHGNTFLVPKGSGGMPKGATLAILKAARGEVQYQAGDS